MKRSVTILLLFALLLSTTTIFSSCKSKEPNTVTEEGWQYAFTEEALENVTISSKFTFPNVKGEGAVKIEYGKIFVNVILSDGTNYALCTDDTYYYYYDGTEWFYTSRIEYPNYAFATTIEEQIHNFDMSSYFSSFTYNQKTDSYIAENVSFYLLEEYDFSKVEVQFKDSLLYKITFTFSDHTKKNPDTQTLIFEDYGATVISMLYANE